MYKRTSMHHHGCTAPSQWLVEDGDVRWHQIGLGAKLKIRARHGTRQQHTRTGFEAHVSTSWSTEKCTMPTDATPYV